MTQELQIFKHEEFGGVRVVEQGGEFYFVGTDVATALGFKDAFGALKKHVDEEDKLVCQIDSAGQRRNVTAINESGVYSLILRSNLPKAKEFKHWVTGEVLPSIRKNGMYINPNAPIDPRFLRKMADELEERDKKIAQQAETIAFLQPKADYTDVVLESKEHLTSELIAKEYGQRAQWLHEVLGKQGKIYKRGRHIYMKAPFDKEGYRTSETVTLERGKTVVNHYWTQKGRWFIYNTLKKIGIVPLDEREKPMATLL